ncbi:MAG: ABC transporter ATP-binding protein [Candidatus Omnitrophota bacterium]
MIEIANITKSFGNHPVLNNLSLKINTGETMVIIGRSGCGKSVLLKHIIGLMSPDMGRIIIDGQDINKLRGKKIEKFRLNFGMLFQGAALFDSLTVRENVGFALFEHTNTPHREIDAKVSASLAAVGLKGVEGFYPSELSGGMKKRVGLARAICIDPRIILYDEPTTGVDPIGADAINDLIIELHHTLSITSVVVTHDMTSAYKVADKIAMLYQGGIIEVDAPAKIKQTTNPVVRQFITGAAEGPITNR